MARKPRPDPDGASPPSSPSRLGGAAKWGALVVLVSGIGAFGWALQAFAPADRVASVVWARTTSGERLVIHEQVYRSSESGSWVEDRLVLVDPELGEVAQVKVDLVADSERGAELLGASGEWLWFHHPFASADALEAVAVESGESRPLAVVLGRFPEILQPLYTGSVREDGRLNVESDDKRAWVVDLREGWARPASEVPGTMVVTGESGGACRTDDGSDGETTIRLTTQATERHSQGVMRQLVAATDAPPLATGFADGFFLCNRPTSPVIAKGAAFVVEPTAPPRVTRVDRRGTRGWTWSPGPEPVSVWAGWAWGDGVIVRHDRTFTRLDGAGTAVWTVER